MRASENDVPNDLEPSEIVWLETVDKMTWLALPACWTWMLHPSPTVTALGSVRVTSAEEQLTAKQVFWSPETTV